MHIAPHFRACQPALLTISKRNHAIKRGCRFPCHKGARRRLAHEKTSQHTPCLSGADTNLDGNARGTQPFDAGTIYTFVRIGNSNDNPCNFPGDQSVGTGTGLARMGARLKRDIGGGAGKQRRR